jgi:hypothetical protein
MGFEIITQESSHKALLEAVTKQLLVKKLQAGKDLAWFCKL